MNRDAALARFGESFDVLIIGGGATGLGAAVDAASRGYRTALIEAEDFAKATSSRSTKLVHGGVRYLAQGNVHLVREALHERSRLLENAPHLVSDLAFVIPAYARQDIPYYAIGLTAYDLLAGRSNFGRARVLSKRGTVARVPGIAAAGLYGSVVYHDGLFDDARLALALARTAVNHGGVVANYVRAERLIYAGEQISGVVATDRESGGEFTLNARCVINATGIFVDELRLADRPNAPRLLALSRGTHIVVPASVLGGDAAILVPKTSDGRVVFAIPWHRHVVIGTTDVPVAAACLDPVPDESEIEYIIATVNRYLQRPIGRPDVTATFAGLRPLVNSAATKSTSKLSREHAIDVSPRGLISIAGGKWTTYRKMGEDVVDAAAQQGGLAFRPSVTTHLPLHGATTRFEPDEALRGYGTDAIEVGAVIRSDPALGELLHPRLPYTGAQVVYAAREEMARTVDDVVARRTRALFLDAVATVEIAPRVARLLARELGRSPEWEAEQLSSFAPIGAIGLIGSHT